MKNYSSIQVSKDTRDRLKKLALTPRESYENIILRLLDAKLGGREICYLISSDDGVCSVKAVVDWGLDKENIMFDVGGVRVFNLPSSVDGVDDGVWGGFVDELDGLVNLFNILSVLEFDEEIRAGGLVLKRVS